MYGAGRLTLLGDVFAAEGLPQLVEELAVELVEGGLGSRFWGVQKGRGLRVPGGTHEGCSSRRTGEAGAAGLRGTHAVAGARTAGVDVVVILDDGHHESHCEVWEFELRQHERNKTRSAQLFVQDEFPQLKRERE